jgi:predicted DNA-binding protein (MmcQ/YjbR family)
MDYADFREFCLSKKGVTEDFPFDETTACLRVMGKIFAICDIGEGVVKGIPLGPFAFINLKCEPEKAAQLREENEAIKPGWHMNKKHWNSVYMDGSLSDKFIRELIDHAYLLVESSLLRKLKEELKNL